MKFLFLFVLFCFCTADDLVTQKATLGEETSEKQALLD